MKLKEFWELLKRTFQEYGEDKVPRLAATLSYHDFFTRAAAGAGNRDCWFYYRQQ